MLQQKLKRYAREIPILGCLFCFAIFLDINDAPTSVINAAWQTLFVLSAVLFFSFLTSFLFQKR